MGASRALKGSSSSSKSGSSTRARARLARWASPPESERARLFARRAIPNFSSQVFTRGVISLPGMPLKRSPEATLSYTLMSISRGSCKTRPVLRRYSSRLPEYTSLPSFNMLPEAGCSSPADVSSIVLLPAPLGPITTRVSPRRISSSSTSSTRCPPRTTVIPLRDNNACGFNGASAVHW